VERRGHSIALRGELLTPQAQNLMLELSQIMTDAALNPKELDALDRLDREAEFSDWLGLHGFSDAASAAFIESGIQVNQVESLSKLIRHDSFEHLLRILAADHAIFSLSREIEEASRRIADLVQAVKAYSYMDRLPVTEVDVEQGIEVTLRMFQHELKHNFQVKKSFSGDLPKIRANGGELNQIWTNLIDNAIDAMAESETKVLEVRTCTEPGGILVEIIDSGPGIPAEIQARIFDAFFTTKEVGKGTGLGLDIVHRIVRDHHGSIRVSSRPGRTVFQVRLPDQSVRDGHGAG